MLPTAPRGTDVLGLCNTGMVETLLCKVADIRCAFVLADFLL